jgi:hypothetical protein
MNEILKTLLHNSTVGDTYVYLTLLYELRITNPQSNLFYSTLCLFDQTLLPLEEHCVLSQSSRDLPDGSHHGLRVSKYTLHNG